ncbi:MAG: ABC transporter permease [bacterium]|nr:ABC transporter permease [bacterium]
MWSYLGRRLLVSVVTVAGIVVVVFFIMRILPGDAAAVRAGPYASEEKLEQIREQFGLSDPVPTQFVNYVRDAVRGDLGTSIRTGGKVTEELLIRLPASLELAFYAVLLAVLAGVPVGIVAAARRDTWIDRAARVVAVLGSSMAFFWLGLMLTFLFFFRLGWFPGPVGRLAITTEPPETITGFFTVDAALAGNWALMWEAFTYLALPAVTVGFVLSAPIIKIVRSSMIETLDSEYVRTARALGVPHREVLFRDGFRNALIPVTTAIGIIFGYMLGGNIIVELIFAWPGVGRYAYEALRVNDLEALQGFVIVVGLLYIVLNVVIDFVYSWIDPRIKLGQRVVA